LKEIANLKGWDSNFNKWVINLVTAY
jgi:hypothetical protein